MRDNPDRHDAIRSTLRTILQCELWTSASPTGPEPCDPSLRRLSEAFYQSSGETQEQHRSVSIDHPFVYSSPKHDNRPEVKPKETGGAVASNILEGVRERGQGSGSPSGRGAEEGLPETASALSMLRSSKRLADVHGAPYTSRLEILLITNLGSVAAGPAKKRRLSSDRAKAVSVDIRPYTRQTSKPRIRNYRHDM